MFSSVRYGYARSFNDAEDALTPPPLDTFQSEWGPSRGDARHRLNWNVGGPIIWGISASISGRLLSGTPYNITTGLDDNADSLFTDRPLGRRATACVAG